MRVRFGTAILLARHTCYERPEILMVLSSVIAAAVLVFQPVGTSMPATPFQAVIAHEDLKSLSLDQLIDRLGRVGQESDPEKRTLDPYSKEMKLRLANGAQLTAEQWKRALVRTEAIVMRSRWLAGTPFIVPMQQPWWLNACVVTLTPVEGGLSTLQGGTPYQETCGTMAACREQGQLHQELGTFIEGNRTFTFDVRVERGGCWRETKPETKEVWSGQISFDVEFVKNLDEVLPPLRGPEVDEALRSSMGASVLPHSGKEGKPASILVLDLDTKEHPELVSAAIQMRVELLRDNEVKSIVKIALTRDDPTFNINSVYKSGEPLFTFAALKGLNPALRDDKTELARWTIRASSVDEDVLSLWHVKSRWVGSFEVPLAKAFELEADRTKGKRRMFWMP